MSESPGWWRWRCCCDGDFDDDNDGGDDGDGDVSPPPSRAGDNCGASCESISSDEKPYVPPLLLLLIRPPPTPTPLPLLPKRVEAKDDE